MTLPFTQDEFFDVLAAYNERLWPLVLVLWLMTTYVVVILTRARPVRPWLTRSSSGRSSSPILTIRFGMAPSPTELVCLQDRLGVVAQRLADLEHCPEFLPY